MPVPVSVSSWSRTLCTAAGAALAGPGGALVGGLLPVILPGPREVATSVLSGLTTGAIQKTGQILVERLVPDEKQQINHDLQTAFRGALREALHDLGGERCFPRAWKAKTRDVPPVMVYPLTPQANQLWQEKSPLAEQVCRCFHEMERLLAEQKMLPLVPPGDRPALRVFLNIDDRFRLLQSELQSFVFSFQGCQCFHQPFINRWLAPSRLGAQAIQWALCSLPMPGCQVRRIQPFSTQ